MDQRLSNTQYLAGNTITIADISGYPWAVSMEHQEMSAFNNLQRWESLIEKCSGVRCGMNIPE